MKKGNRNIKVVAENIKNENGFNIYLVFSGKKEYLMQHRHNGLLYGFIKDGVCIEDIRRWSRGEQIPVKGATRRRSGQTFHRLDKSIRYLLANADKYIQEREVS